MLRKLPSTIYSENWNGHFDIRFKYVSQLLLFYPRTGPRKNILIIILWLSHDWTWIRTTNQKVRSALYEKYLNQIVLLPGGNWVYLYLCRLEFPPVIARWKYICTLLLNGAIVHRHIVYAVSPQWSKKWWT